MDLGAWLRSLGLAQYEAAFRENAINEAILPKLTAEDLKDIGVTAVGHRRVLLDAIAALRGETPPKQENAPSTATGPADKPSRVGGRVPEAERRQLTVMFCDLVGSTELSGRLDPEDMRSVIGAYHRCCMELIERNGGFVAKYMGDGVLAYFGYPKAHEDDAERAVQAGLAIVGTAPRLENALGETLHVRVGIATGIVVVGDLVGSGESSERGVVGDAPNLAARLQGIAEPDRVVIAERTRRLIGDLFELQDLGLQELKGIVGGTRAFGVLRARSIESRFEAMHRGGLTPLVGREEEIELLLRAWAESKAGEGRVVLLSGEAGIGKSRLTAAFLERLSGEPLIRVRYFCSPQHVDSAFHPMISQLERAAQFSREDGQRSKLDKLDAVLTETATAPEDAALLAEMMGLGNDGRYPKNELPPLQRRQKTLAALVAQIETRARGTATLLIFEDAHWADPSSIEALASLTDRIARMRVLLILCYRPEFASGWARGPHVGAIVLDRLTPSDTAKLIEGVIGEQKLPEAIRRDIIDRADGVPLFAEEITKAAMEAQKEGSVVRVVSATPTAADAIPATLHASLMSRLDRLGTAKEVAQIGAAIGRDFPHDLLALIAEKRENELATALDQLVDAGLLFQDGTPPTAKYLFKHALVQDAAYGTLLRETRRTVHFRIAHALESQFPDTVARQPELLARHFTEAGQIDKAAPLWGRAGLKSVGQSALLEAKDQLTRALAQIATLPTTRDLRRLEIELQVALISPLFHLSGYASTEARAAVGRAQLLVERANSLGEQPEDPLLLLVVLNGLWAANMAAFNGGALLEIADQLVTLADQQPSAATRMVAHRSMGVSLLCTGKPETAKQHLDRAIRLYVSSEHRVLAMRLGQDVVTLVLAWRSLAQWILGYPDGARADVEQALENARSIGHAGTTMYAQWLGGLTNMLLGSYGLSDKLLKEVAQLATAKGALFWQAAATRLRACVLVLTGQQTSPHQLLAAVIARPRSTESSFLSPYFLTHLAMSHTSTGEAETAARTLDRALAALSESKESWFEPEVHRIIGEVELGSPISDASVAEAEFGLALRIAREQRAKSWELRAAMSMARLWRDQGKCQQAHDLLAPVYGWFTEGFDTLDLKEAKVLRDELAS